MKNLTGSALQWKGKTYNPQEEVPEEVAQEMQLEKLPDQIKGQQAQQGQEPPPVSDPYDVQALVAAQTVSPPIVLLAREIEPTQQSTPDVSFAAVVNFGAQSTPVNLKPLEEEGAKQQERSRQREGRQRRESLRLRRLRNLSNKLRKASSKLSKRRLLRSLSLLQSQPSRQLESLNRKRSANKRRRLPSWMRRSRERSRRLR